MLFGWELMGLCSFMLIGHWWEEQENSDAALKAFFTTRTGDIGLLVGIIILFFAAGQTFDIADINARGPRRRDRPRPCCSWRGVALLVGVIGKCAQFPLHTWLPDAMAGPTPVSALIHAATMVVAGVYLLARLYGVFWEGFSIGDGGINLVAVIGAITIIIAALLAFVQDDIKKVLAYSTVSQLGYMVMALGVGAWTAAIFHLFTHAFFKALLFLGSGSVSHAVHSFDMKKDMGGLRKYMPTTYGTFMIGSVALAGIFPLAGFWSKDEILLGAGENGYEFFMVVGLIGAFMTAAYMTRCVYLTFFGEYRGHGHPHESPPAITVPLDRAGRVLGRRRPAQRRRSPSTAFTDWSTLETRSSSRPASSTTPSRCRTPLLSTVVALPASPSACLLYFGSRLPHGLTAAQPRPRARLHAPRQQVLPRPPLHRRRRGLHQGPDRPGRVLGQPERDRRRRQRRRHRLAARLGEVVYERIDQGVVDGAVNGAGLGAEDAGGLPARHPDRPGPAVRRRCSSARPPCSPSALALVRHLGTTRETWTRSTTGR